VSPLTLLLSALMVLVGVAMIVQAIAGGGGPLAIACTIIATPTRTISVESSSVSGLTPGPACAAPRARAAGTR